MEPGGFRNELAAIQGAVHSAKGSKMSADAFHNGADNDIDMEEVDRKMRMHQIFIDDVLKDPSLVDLLPDEPEYLDFFARGSRPDVTPDFQTPHVDVYIVDRDSLHPNHRIA